MKIKEALKYYFHLSELGHETKQFFTLGFVPALEMSRI